MTDFQKRQLVAGGVVVSWISFIVLYAELQPGYGFSASFGGMFLAGVGLFPVFPTLIGGILAAWLGLGNVSKFFKVARCILGFFLFTGVFSFADNYSCHGKMNYDMAMMLLKIIAIYFIPMWIGSVLLEKRLVKSWKLNRSS